MIFILCCPAYFMVKMERIGREELSSIGFPICLVAEKQKPWYVCFFELVHTTVCPELLVKATPVGAIGLQCTTPVMTHNRSLHIVTELHSNPFREFGIHSDSLFRVIDQRYGSMTILLCQSVRIIQLW
jgi:hypothetical protein